MAYRTAPNLPNELLSLIFEFSYHAARKSYAPYGRSLLEMSWDNPLTPNFFPFNLVSVCRLWRDILAQVPAYWTRLRFDVDHKPVLPAEAVSWARGQPFKVQVLGESPMDIFPITAALLSDTPNCNTIKYNVKYSSSLPHFAELLVFLDKSNPQLYSIELECKTDDSGRRISALPRNLNPTPLVNSYNLENLVLPCRMFLDTCREHPRWYGRLLTCDLSLTLSQYCFHSPDPEDYTFQELLGHLGAMSQYLSCIDLRDLSLGYQPRSVQAKTVASMPPDVEMYNIDPALINLYFMTNSYLCNGVTFYGCSIPRFDAEDGLKCNTLWLHNIADRYSLFNIFDAWRPIHGTATIKSCPFFDDDFLQWLGKPQVLRTGEQPMLCSGCLECLTIIDCPNFTAQTLCQMLRARADAATGHHDPGIAQRLPITKLRVSGQVPTPSEQDAEWLRSHFGHSLKWNVRGENGGFEYDIKRQVPTTQCGDEA